jgi:hypothetical protein
MNGSWLTTGFILFLFGEHPFKDMGNSSDTHVDLKLQLPHFNYKKKSDDKVSYEKKF